MNIEKCEFGTVISLGSLEDFCAKLEQEGKKAGEVFDFTDAKGMSLLEVSLAAGKFDIANYLLSNNCKVNHVSSEGCNEFHYIASRIRYEGALEVAEILLERGVSLAQKDKKYGNSAFFTLCQEIFKVRTEETMKFLENCLKRIEDFDACNKAGYSIRMLINQRGTERLNQIMESKR